MPLEFSDGSVQQPWTPQPAPSGVSPLESPPSALPRPSCAPLSSAGFLLKNSQTNEPENNTNDHHWVKREDGVSDGYHPVSAASCLRALELIVFLSLKLPAHRDAQSTLSGLNRTPAWQG